MSAAQRALLVSGLASFVLMGLAQAIFGPALPVYERIYGLTTAQAGWLISAFWVGCFLGVAGMFVVAGRVGPRPALAASAIGGVLLGASPVWAGVLAGGVVFGMGYGSLAAVYNPRVLAAFGARGGAMMSLLNAIFSLGAIAAPLVFLALGSEPRPTFLLFAGFAALIWLGSGSLSRDGAGASVQTGGFRPHLPILLFGMLAICMEAALVSLGPSALVRAGVVEAQAAGLLSLFYVAYLVARGVLIFVADRIAPFAIYVGAMGATVLCALGAILIDPAVFFVPMGASASLFFHAFFVTGVRKMGSDARVPPVIIGSGLVGAIVLPLLVAQVMGLMGPLGFFWLILGWAGVLALASALALRSMLR
jgi:MFS family permease